MFPQLVQEPEKRLHLFRSGLFQSFRWVLDIVKLIMSQILKIVLMVVIFGIQEMFHKKVIHPGSTIRLLEQGGESQAVYGYDEFGEDTYNTQGQMQPFGYTAIDMIM